jgi:hypothetical protein
MSIGRRVHVGPGSHHRPNEAEPHPDRCKRWVRRLPRASAVALAFVVWLAPQGGLSGAMALVLPRNIAPVLRVAPPRIFGDNVPLSVRCGAQPCTLSGYGTIVIDDKRSVLPVVVPRLALPAGQTGWLTVRLPSVTRLAVSQALKEGRKVTMYVVIRAAGALGSVKMTRVAIALRE